MVIASDKESQSNYHRGMQFTPQGIGGYDECWYPICLSTEAKQGQIVGLNFLDGKVIVIRHENGEVSAYSAYCRHLGVDLSGGKLIDDNIRCPYHHWQYDKAGQCVKTAVGDNPPSKAKLFKFPIREQMGLVWIYNGETPAYELPHFSADENELEFVAVRAIETSLDPYLVYSNSMDIQHLIAVHGAKFSELPSVFDVQKHSLSYTQIAEFPKIGLAEQKVKLWGTNCISIEATIAGRPSFMMSAGLTVTGPLTRTFNVSATLKGDSKSWQGKKPNRLLDKIKAKIHVRALDAFGKKLNAEDDSILEAVSFRRDNLSASDKPLAMYFDYAKEFPRSTVVQDMICNDYRNAAPQINIRHRP